jgi:hypothetical protein
MLERPPHHDRRRRRVTALRNISGKLSGSRNTERDLSEFDPDACFYCRKRFDRGQMRYPIRNFNWPEPDFGSVCMPCFKKADFDVTSRQQRYERECQGCGEPILTRPKVSSPGRYAASAAISARCGNDIGGRIRGAAKHAKSNLCRRARMRAFARMPVDNLPIGRGNGPARTRMAEMLQRAPEADRRRAAAARQARWRRRARDGRLVVSSNVPRDAVKHWLVAYANHE